MVLGEACFPKYKHCNLCSESGLFKFHERKIKKKGEKCLLKKMKNGNRIHFMGADFNCFTLGCGWGGEDYNSDGFYLKGNTLLI